MTCVGGMSGVVRIGPHCARWGKYDLGLSGMTRGFNMASFHSFSLAFHRRCYGTALAQRSRPALPRHIQLSILTVLGWSNQVCDILLQSQYQCGLSIIDFISILCPMFVCQLWTVSPCFAHKLLQLGLDSFCGANCNSSKILTVRMLILHPIPTSAAPPQPHHQHRQVRVQSNLKLTPALHQVRPQVNMNINVLATLALTPTQPHQPHQAPKHHHQRSKCVCKVTWSVL